MAMENHGTSLFHTISIWSFSIAMRNYQRIHATYTESASKLSNLAKTILAVTRRGENGGIFVGFSDNSTGPLPAFLFCDSEPSSFRSLGWAIAKYAKMGPSHS